MTSGDTKQHTQSREESVTLAEKLNLEDPRVVLSLLEADQVVAAKTRTRFGKRNLSGGVRIMLWGLRIYVAVMLVIVLISVIRAVHPAQ